MPPSSNRKRSKKANPDTPKAIRPPSVFNYTSVCCSVPATKEACERTAEDREEGTYSKSSLGTWNCSKCRRKCSVTRSKNRQEVEVAA